MFILKTRQDELSFEQQDNIQWLLFTTMKNRKKIVTLELSKELY